ncbi:hypothetical protein [Stutzerimonas kunmingensis]|uniref:hypothetical protein n=1 Tax=Stutzerimonas kunmingensis TaxID=1211807 RepID=UPI0028B07DFE|nr:hypothetical protein [Stutzerimonas kunmingensis]
MTDPQRCQQAATAPACLEKGADLLTPRHLVLIRAVQQAFYCATAQHSSTAELGTALTAWQAAAEHLAVALVARLEVIEEADHA